MVCDRAALDPWRSCPRWVAVDELEREVHLAEKNAERPVPVPVYLLARTHVDGRYHHGQAVCLPGAVRNHVAAERLAEWAERLAIVSIRLEILSGESPECTIGPGVRARIVAHLTRQAQLTEQASAEWELTRQEIVKLDRQVQLVLFEERRGCGLQWHEPTLRPQFREGDIVYAPPPLDRSTQPGVAVVFSVHRRLMGSRRLPTGEFDLLMWDVHLLKFTRLERDVLDGGFSLFPPCCGRGSKCPNFLLSQFGCYEWPNGDALDLRVLLLIPGAFAGFLKNELREGGWQQRRALQEAFKTLLGPHYEPVVTTEDVAAERSEHEMEHASEHESEHASEFGEVSICEDPSDEYYDSA